VPSIGGGTNRSGILRAAAVAVAVGVGEGDKMSFGEGVEITELDSVGDDGGAVVSCASEAATQSPNKKVSADDFIMSSGVETSLDIS